VWGQFPPARANVRIFSALFRLWRLQRYEDNDAVTVLLLRSCGASGDGAGPKRKLGSRRSLRRRQPPGHVHRRDFPARRTSTSATGSAPSASASMPAATSARPSPACPSAIIRSPAAVAPTSAPCTSQAKIATPNPTSTASAPLIHDQYRPLHDECERGGPIVTSDPPPPQICGPPREQTSEKAQSLQLSIC
jgi:hypothetical protein